MKYLITINNKKHFEFQSLYQQTKSKATQITPDLTELPNTDFKLVLPQRTQSSKFHYSNDGQLFIKGDVQFHLDVSYKPVDDSVLFIRLMSVIPNNISKPVVRCENHASKGNLFFNIYKVNNILILKCKFNYNLIDLNV